MDVAKGGAISHPEGRCFRASISPLVDKFEAMESHVAIQQQPTILRGRIAGVKNPEKPMKWSSVSDLKAWSVTRANPSPYGDPLVAWKRGSVIRRVKV